MYYANEESNDVIGGSIIGGFFSTLYCTILKEMRGLPTFLGRRHNKRAQSVRAIEEHSLEFVLRTLKRYVQRANQQFVAGNTTDNLYFPISKYL